MLIKIRISELLSTAILSKKTQLAKHVLRMGNEK